MAFNFKHALCRVKFSITFDDPNHRYAIGIKNVQLKGTPNTGTFALGNSHDTQQLTDGTWSKTSGDFTANYGETEAKSTYDETNSAYSPAVTDYRYLIPGTYTADDRKLQPAMDITLYIRNIPNTQPEWVFQQEFSYLLTGDKLLKKISATFQPGHSYVISGTFKAKNDDDPNTPDDPTIDPDGNLYPIEFTVEEVTDFDDGESGQDTPPHPVTW